MAGTSEGGKKAAQTNLARDPDFYSKIGQKGGKVTDLNNGFRVLAATDPERFKEISKRGGQNGRRTKNG